LPVSCGGLKSSLLRCCSASCKDLQRTRQSGMDQINYHSILPGPDANSTCETSLMMEMHICGFLLVSSTMSQARSVQSHMHLNLCSNVACNGSVMNGICALTFDCVVNNAVAKTRQHSQVATLLADRTSPFFMCS
jgi:hypothetical protein